MPNQFPATPQQRLLAMASYQMSELSAGVAELLEQINSAGALVPETMRETVNGLRERLLHFSTPVTFIGQVKAGKTTVVNSLAGRPGLLPADVNPWTSVVTTVHINEPRKKNLGAEFRFFDRDEWNNLVIEGGRLGQMARRAGADSEFEEIKAQIEAMRGKSRERLGRNFELLLGNRHKYDTFDSALIERYVCLGDEDDPSAEANQGRFADITRSADLYLDIPAYPIALSLQDTPGVNDPFLIREQITLRSIGDSALCVVVLSASQAMSSVDLALIQLLSAMEGRRVIIFINRVDELDDPVNEVDEIRESLDNTLQRNGIEGIEAVIFGSALWAEAALTNSLDALDERSRTSLHQLSDEDPDTELTPDMAWAQSGLPDLQATIGRITAETSGRRLLEGTRRHLSNVVTAALAKDAARKVIRESRLAPDLVRIKLERLRGAVDKYLRADMAGYVANLSTVIDQCSRDFIRETVASLVEQAVRTGSVGQERCDPMQLRVRLRAAYSRFTGDARTLFNSVGLGLADAMTDLFGQMLGETAQDLHLEPPQSPLTPPPIALGGTIIVDLKTTWFRGWVTTRLRSNTLARDYEKLLTTEVEGITSEVLASARRTVEEMSNVLMAFLGEQSGLAMAIAAGADPADTTIHLPILGRRDALEKLESRLRSQSDQWKEQGFGNKVVGLRNAV